MPTEVVRWKGLIYPAKFSWTWVRSDGLQVELDVRLDEVNGPVPTEVTIRSAEGIRGGDFRLPIPSMVRRAAAEYYGMHEQIDGPGAFIYFPVQLTGRVDQARLARIAQLYEQAVSEGLGVTELIEKFEGVGSKQAYSLIGKARAAGLLEPSRPGRKKTKKK
jgi:hypothetical protein